MKLSEEEIQEKLGELAGWENKEGKIEKEYSFEGFDGAIEFVNEVADLARIADHHPDIHIFYNKVKIVLSTHDVGGVSEKDFALATQINATTQ